MKNKFCPTARRNMIFLLLPVSFFVRPLQ